MNVLAELRSRLDHSYLGSLGLDSVSEYLAMVRPSQDPKFGDYQANFSMPLAKRLGRPPRDIAQDAIKALSPGEMLELPEVAGPGFINFRLRREWIEKQLQSAVADDRLGIPKTIAPQTIVIDYSAPNVAKPMHVGHIRSTVIGDSLYRTLKFLGHTVIGDNHIGDWGTQFGMIIYGWKHFRDENAYRADRVQELSRLYRHVHDLIGSQKDSPTGKSVLDETAKLHAGDQENLRLWREFLPSCLEDIDRIYRRLGVRFDETLGESFYHDRLGEVVGDLQRRGIATESDGAVCVFLDGFEAPMIVRKRDGAYLYATSDLATIKYRMDTWRPDLILYVVDHRQSLHFEQLFATARLWGYSDVKLRHIGFGTVLGTDGRPFRTRAGDTVGLMPLLDEAVARAKEIITSTGTDVARLPPEEQDRVAEVVGIGALKYADLSQNRTSDYTFSYDKMLAMNGNTATYMQYAYARVRSIFRKGDVDLDRLRARDGGILLKEPAERTLGLELLRFSEALDMVVDDFRPNFLTTYLFDLANRYSTFFEQCPVLKAPDEPTQKSRFLLCDLTARTIETGLRLLGIDVVERM
jgi:arginyl-tRNA synthetase